MLPCTGSKVKREEEDGARGSWGVTGLESAAEQRARVKGATAKMAAEAGFRRSDSGRADGGGAPPVLSASPIMKTPRYDGRADWEAFHAQFELLAQASKWTAEVKALQLAMCLTGDALSSLLLLSPEDRCDYNELVGALRRRFGSCRAASLLRSELCSRQRRPGEPLRELANDVEGLVHRTYAHMPPAIRSELARDHFLQALLPPELRTQTLLGHPKSLQEALEVATEREMLCTGLPGTARDGGPRVRTVNEVALDTSTPAWAEELTQLVRAATLREDRDPRLDRRVCWGCGQPGHLVRRCPKAATRRGNGTGTA